MSLDIKYNIFWKELILFGATIAVGIFSAYRNIPLINNGIIRPESLSWSDIIILLAFFVIFSFILFRFKRLSAVFLKFFLILVVFSGSQIVIGSFVQAPWDLFGALIVALLFIIARNVLVHDLGILLGIAGVGSLLGVSISPDVGVILLVVLSFYDIIAVYGTKHMVHLAEGMVESGAVFGFIIPFGIDGLLHHHSEVRQKIGDRFMILGSGDVGLPLVMASSLVVVSLGQAVITSLFSLIGLFITHLIFVNQKSRRPMAALPPIATLTIIGYLVSLI